jgi:PhnB protein
MPIQTSIQPWLSVNNGLKAIAFYKSAFGAIETYRLDAPDGSLVARLSIQGAAYWLSSGPQKPEEPTAESLGGGTIRMILVTENPEELFHRALAAGAKEIFPVGEEHGWKLGRLEDPFGLHWEIGHEINHRKGSA